MTEREFSFRRLKKVKKGSEKFSFPFCLYKQNVLDKNVIRNEENYLVATAESASATKKYKVWMENGFVKTELIKQTIYEEEIFTLQALN